MAGTLSFEERKFIDKCYYKYVNAVEVQRQIVFALLMRFLRLLLFCSFKKNHQGELASVKSDTSLKLMEQRQV